AREDEIGIKRLVAYIIARERPSPSMSEVREFLQERLPEYMLPSACVMLESLPLTTNGKVEHRALPAPERIHPELDRSFMAPRTSVEELLAKIWAEVLGVEQIGIHDNFFALGGDSILSIQIVSRVKQAGLEVTP